VEVDFFDFAVGAHHAGLAPEGNREHSIGHQVSALNVGFMEHLPRIRWPQRHLRRPCRRGSRSISIRSMRPP
ncbi:hypothetical protein CAZ27_09795, partial [Pseudomonas aeruginosa]